MDFPSQELLEPRVAYEDESLVAVVKPARMHSAPGRGLGDLCAWVFERYPEARLAGRAAGRPIAEGGLLHRLDYETSGLVLFARKSEAFASLALQQENGGFYKEYAALSRPSSEALPGSRPAQGIPSGIEPDAWAAARDVRDTEALAARLSEAKGCGVDCAFRPFGPKGARVACLDNESAGERRPYRGDILASAARAGDALELRLGLSRGFRHQLRAQLAWIGLPISGDTLYGGASDERLRLYAVRLCFAHPASLEPFSIRADT